MVVRRGGARPDPVAADPWIDPRAFLSRPAPEVAPLLLGWSLQHTTPDGTVVVSLTEVEAYDGTSDPASHAFRGRSARNQVMFGPAGRLYVYLSHGLHNCANVVTGPDGDASAVLLRAGRVSHGVDLARTRRGERVADRSLARGPGCLGQALGLTTEHDSRDLLAAGSLTLRPPRRWVDPSSVVSGPRVGVSRADDVAWRFWLTGDATVSAYRKVKRGGDKQPPP
ncbi:MAG: DNA-3-methyladenine glycosylase [Actinomycetes bacterium]